MRSHHRIARFFAASTGLLALFIAAPKLVHAEEVPAEESYSNATSAKTLTQLQQLEVEERYNRLHPEEHFSLGVFLGPAFPINDSISPGLQSGLQGRWFKGQVGLEIESGFGVFGAVDPSDSTSSSQFLSNYWLSAGPRFNFEVASNIYFETGLSLAAKLWAFSFDRELYCGAWSCNSSDPYSFAIATTLSAGLRIQHNASLDTELNLRFWLDGPGWALQELVPGFTPTLAMHFR